MVPGSRRLIVSGLALALLCNLPPVAGWAAAEAPSPSLPTQGQPARDFTLMNVAGKPVHLSDFKGKVILLTFWACYTDTCFSTVGALDELLAQAAPSDLVAPTVCSEIPPALAAQGYAGLLARCSAGQRILVDPKREAAELYRVRDFPAAVLIGRDFTIREFLVGVPPLRDPALRARIKALVLETAASPPAGRGSSAE